MKCDKNNLGHGCIELASRCVRFNNVDISNYWFSFRMFYVDGGTVDAGWLYDSRGPTGRDSYAVRPVVEIDLSKANVGATGDGSSGNAYSITAK